MAILYWHWVDHVDDEDYMVRVVGYPDGKRVEDVWEITPEWYATIEVGDTIERK
jgi:hypothetical protein